MGLWRWSLLLWCFDAALIHGSILGGAQRPQQSPPQPAGWSPAPSSSWGPTLEPGASSGDPEGSAAALGFLQTGDAQRLARANCSQSIAAGAAGTGPPPVLRATLRAAPEALAHAANFLNMLLQTNDIREASVAEDVEWYQALVRSLVEGHPWVRRAVLALDAHPLAAKPRLMLQATKKDGEILLQDVSSAAPNLANLSWHNEWFNALKSQRTPLLRKRVLSNDLRSMETPKWQRGDSYVGDPGHVRWSPPFLECQDGRFLPTWTITLSSAFYGLKPDLSPEFKGVVRVDIDLRDVGIDQCASGPGWFADTHRCDLNSTQESRGFVLGRYLCQCKPGFYGVGGAASGAQAGAVDGGSRLACRPCRPGCSTCEDDAPCLIQEDWALRAAVLSCQACCMLAVFLSMLVSYHFRRSKRIRASGVVLLETILFGSLLLYFPVFILYFKPSIFRCIVLRWVRTLGFAIVYGTITLKLYRVLKVFLSRTAQRAPYVSSGRVLKMLGLILLLVLWFLAAWTIGMLENIDKNIPLVIRTQTARGLHFYICGHDRWDYMMVIAEMLFLLWGSFLCYAMRAVPSAFHEPRYMGIALHNELMISAAFHVVRFVMVPSLHPDWTLLLFFAHTHGTITMTLALLFIPKFLHAGSPLREEIAAEVYEDELDMRRSGSCLNSSIASAWSEHSLDPDDIREELKKLYAQLEVHKTWSMAANNPHLPKKRSSRRSLGRSIAHRIAELPEAVGRRSSRGERVGTPARRRSSAKGVPNAGAASLRMRDDGTWYRAAAPHKSRSTEGPARASPTLGIPGDLAPEGKMPVATALEQSDSDSLDAAPLVCKSASAHDLAGHEQHPPPPLQKSLSVVAGAREEALLAASRAAREKWHRNQSPTSEHPMGPPREAGKLQSPGDAHLPATSSPAKGGSREDISPPGDGKVQKHVTYGPVKSVSVDSAHVPGRVRVAVRRTPPPPPVRCQSLGQRAMPAGDSPEPTGTPAGPPEPPMDPMAEVAEPEKPPEGPEEEASGRASPRAKGRLLGTAPIPAQVCPWELVQEEILSRRQKATEATDSGTPSDAAAEAPSPRLPPQKTSLRGLGLAIKAFNRSRGKSILKGKREGEGSLGKRGQEWEGGSRRERPSLAETAAVSLGGVGREPAAKSPEWSGQRPGSEPSTHGWHRDTVPCQHNNNASSTGDAASWGSSEGQGQWDSPALGTGDGEKPAEEPSAPGGGLGPPLAVHEIKPSVGHQEGPEHPHETPAVAGSEEAQRQRQRGTTSPTAEQGKEAPVGSTRLSTPEQGVAGPAEGLEGGSRSFHHPPDHAEVEQLQAKPTAGTPRPSTAQRAAAKMPRDEVCPQGALGIPAGKGALLRQEAFASQEDSGVPAGEESPAKALGKGSSQPEPLAAGGNWSAQRVPAGSRSVGAAPAAPGKVGAQAEGSAGEIQADSSLKPEICPWEGSGGERWGAGRGSREGVPEEEAGTEKPPAEPPEAAGRAEGRRAEVCPWESGEGERMVRAEICPWDAEGAQPEQEGERRRLGEGGSSITPESLGLLGARESRSSLRAPRGSSSSEEPPPKPPPKPAPKPAPKSSGLPEVTPRSPASARASVCPWEAAGDDGDAEVCPWERGTASSDGGKLRDGEIPQVENGISQQRGARRGLGETAPAAGKESGHGASPQPREGTKQPGTALRAKHPALPKPASKLAESEKAKVCPWEAEEPPAATEMGPWEEPGAPRGTEAPSQDTRGTPKKGGLEGIKAKLAEMGTSQPAHRDGGTFVKLDRKRLEGSKAESKKLQSMESIKEEVCPWESPGTEQHPEHLRTKSPAMPKSPSSKSQSVESRKAEVCPWETESMDKAEICPWESAGTEQHPEHPRAKSPALPKSPSEKSQSTESRKAEVCPWEAAELKSMDKAEICPWESPGTEQHPEHPRAKSPAMPKSTAEKSQSTESRKAEVCPWEAPELQSMDKAEICPWESPGMEQTPKERRAKSPALPKSPSEKSQSAESRKAEVCPWEAPELQSMDKAEICPWEEAAPPSGKGKSREEKARLSVGSRSPSTGQDLGREIRESRAGKEKEGSGDRTSICPWESPGTEQHPEHPRAKSPALPKSTAEKSQSAESRKAEVCPWETESKDKAEICPWESPGTEQHPEHPRAKSPAMPKSTAEKSQSVESRKAEVCPWETESMDKAEICPWEAAAAPSDRPKPKQGPGDAPKAEKRITRQAALPSPARSLEKGSGQREAICPWDTEQHPEKPRAGSPALPKRPSEKSQSVESRKAEVCPWEAESMDKAEICPWESPGTEQHPEHPRAKSPAMPKSTSEKSQSTESRKAEVCPWEAPELQSMDKAEICPWEEAAPPSGKGKSREEKARLSVGSRSPSTGQDLGREIRESRAGKEKEGSGDRTSICPWESPGTEQHPEHPRAKSPALPKSTAEKSQSTESRKAEVCPWETESMDKAEICPWESAGTEQTPKEHRAKSPALPKSPSEKSQSAESRKAEVCPWETESKDKAEICPWESPGTEQHPEHPHAKSPALPKSPSEKSQSAESRKAEVCPWEAESMDKAEICPWESPGTEQHPEHPRAKSPAMPKSTAEKSQSTESRKAEVCPWETESMDKAEICPWEAAAAPSDRPKPKQGPGDAPKAEKRITRQAALPSLARSLEKGSSQREAICPWDTEQHPEKPRAGSPALPKRPSEKSQSVESRKAEVCPWEAESMDKAEICPWESPGTEQHPEHPRAKSPAMPKSTAEKSQSTESRKAEVCPWEAPELQSMDKAEICPWESPGMEQTPKERRAKSPALPKSPSEKSQSAESRKAEVCPREAPELQSMDKAEICPWEEAAPPSGKGKSREEKARLSVGSRSPSTGQDLGREIRESRAGKEKEGSGDRTSICPWESPGTEQHPEHPRAKSPALPKSTAEKSQSAESRKAEVCPWETESKDKAEICPWESPGTEQHPEHPRAKSPAMPKSTAEKSQSVESRKAEVCPWETESMDKAEICPWEAAAAPSDRPKPKQGPGDAPKAEKRITRQAALPSPARSLEKGSGQREAICPWDTEQHPEKPRAGSPALPKRPSEKSQSVESRKAEVCPWEAESMDKAEICPWESPGTEQHPEHPRAKSPAMPKSTSEKSQSTESRKAEVCPWEAPELQSMDKAEICPWEEAAPPSGKGKSREEKARLSVGSRSPSTGQDLGREIRESRAGKEKEGSGDRTSICPWESPGTEQHPEHPRAKSPALPKSTAEKSQSTESRKAEVCPWETESMDKAEICPWESAGTEQTPKEHRAKSPALPKSPSEKSQSAESRKAEVCPWETESKDKAEICPWESPGTEQHPEHPHAKSPALPKSPSEKSQSAESRKAEVCPWEAESMDKAEICPWESPGTEQHPEHPRAKSPAMPKSTAEKSQSTESRKAEVCPWETESMDKAEICPWEAAAAPSDRPKPKQGPGDAPKAEKRITRQAALPSLARSLEKGSSQREAICPWDTEQHPEKPRAGSPALPKRPSEKSQSVESRKAEVCPWEAESMDKAEICPWESPGTEQHPEHPRAKSPAMPKSTAEKSQSAESRKAEVCPWEAESMDKAEICPWESPGTEQPSLDCATGREPSKKPPSTESRKSDLCPWEAAEPAGSGKESSKPAVPPLGAGRASAGTGQSVLAARASTASPTLLEKSRSRSDVEAEHRPLLRVVPGIQPPWCPGAEPRAQGASRAPAVGGSPSVTEVCPWEAEAPPAAATAEVCPWDVGSTEPTASLRDARVSPEDRGKGMSETKPDVCPWDHE